MKKKLFSIFICFTLLLNIFGCSPSPAKNESTGTKAEYTEATLPEEETTAPSSKEETVAKAIWQDPNNVVLLWSSNVDYEYSIYRSNNPSNGVNGIVQAS